MGRYIDKQLIGTYLNLGKTIEVFLGRINIDKTVISYLELTKNTDNKIQVKLYDHFDEGDLNWLDIYDFSYVDEDEEFEVMQFDNIETTIEGIKTRFQINEVKFVNSGIIQDEYSDLLKSEGRT
jgi:hypothetical protein